MTNEILEVSKFSDGGDSWDVCCPHCNRILGLDKSESPRGGQFHDKLCGGWLQVSEDAVRVKEVEPRPIATLDFTLYVECPDCKEDFNIIDQDDHDLFTLGLFNNRWDGLKGAEVTCPKCDHQFEIFGVEY